MLRWRRSTTSYLEAAAGLAASDQPRCGASAAIFASTAPTRSRLHRSTPKRAQTITGLGRSGEAHLATQARAFPLSVGGLSSAGALISTIRGTCAFTPAAPAPNALVASKAPNDPDDLALSGPGARTPLAAFLA